MIVKNVLFGLILASASSALARPDLNAFLNKPATSTDRLIRQIKTDPQVADRYTRHYAMSKSEVIDYLSSLSPAQTNQDGVYTVYSVPDGGRLKSRTEIVKKGTLVFADMRKVPVLILKCGNPLSRGSSTRS